MKQLKQVETHVILAMHTRMSLQLKNVGPNDKPDIHSTDITPFCCNMPDACVYIAASSVGNIVYFQKMCTEQMCVLLL